MKLRLLHVDLDPRPHLAWGLADDDKVVRFTGDDHSEMHAYAERLRRQELVDVDIEDHRITQIAGPPTRQG